MVGYLKLFMGPMYAGKTTHLIDTCKFVNNSKIVVKHKSDVRYQLNNIVSHDNNHIGCFSINTLKEVYELPDFDTKDNILVDEAQFFQDLYEVVLDLVNNCGKKVFLFGLDGDFKGQPFIKGDFLKLIPFADSIEKLAGKCYLCERPSILSKRIVKDDSQVLVGGADIYQPVCRYHFLNSNIK